MVSFFFLKRTQLELMIKTGTKTRHEFLSKCTYEKCDRVYEYTKRYKHGQMKTKFTNVFSTSFDRFSQLFKFLWHFSAQNTEKKWSIAYKHTVAKLQFQ